MSDRSALLSAQETTAAPVEVEARKQETERQPDAETEGQRDEETRRQGEGEIEHEDAEVAEEGDEVSQIATEAADNGTGRLTPPARQDALTPPAHQDALTPPLPSQEREKVAERIRQSELLPVGLRMRLAELVLAQDGAAAEQAIRAVEASLPGALRLSLGEVIRPAHPAGDVFFHGDAGAISDEQAEALARGQLARSGLLRGQRARVAD